MDHNTPQFKNLANRNVDVIKKNLVSVCGLSVKSLIDKACFSSIDDGCEELINFTANLEQILLHQIKPQKNWYGGAESLHFWSYLRSACKNIPQSCINNIDSIENIKSTIAKGRAFIRCALMEKRLSEYISTAVKQTKLTKKHYMEGAILLSEDANMISGVLLGLNSIDFSFCLKGQNKDLFGSMVIDYSPYLRFTQSLESAYSDGEEMKISTNTSKSSLLNEGNNSDLMWKEKYKTLENKYRGMCEQKGYLEELLRMRENQLDESSLQQKKFIQTVRSTEVEYHRERDQLEQVIIELQAQLYNLKSDHKFLEQRVQSLTVSNQVALGRVKEIQMTEMAGERISSSNSHLLYNDSTSEQLSLTGSIEVGQQVQILLTPDSRSLLSTTSEQPPVIREDSESLVPLTGSLTSQGFKAGEPHHKEEVVSVMESSNLSSQSRDFENISLKAFDGTSSSSTPTNDGISENVGLMSNIADLTTPIDTLKTDSVVTKTTEDNSTGSESPVMVTSSESDEPVHVTLEDVSQTVTLTDAETEGVDKKSCSNNDVALTQSSDSTSSMEEPVHLVPGTLNQQSSESGSSDTASWEVTHDRDLQVTSADEQPDVLDQNATQDEQ